MDDYRSCSYVVAYVALGDNLMEMRRVMAASESYAIKVVLSQLEIPIIGETSAELMATALEHGFLIRALAA